MKFILTILLGLVFFQLTAQVKTKEIDNSIPYKIEKSQLLYPKGTVTSIEEAKTFLLQNLRLENPYGLSLVSYKESNNQNHFTFTKTYKGIEVYHAFVKLNTSKNGSITSLFNSPEIVLNELNEDWPDLNSQSQYVNNTITIHNQKLIWVKKDNVYRKGYLVNYTNSTGLNFEVIVDRNNVLLFELERSNHYSDVDSIAKGFVFLPDPVTSANTSYGASFIDNNDNTNPSIDAERIDVDLEVTYDSNNQTFYLENQYVKVVDISPPTIDPVTSNSPNFYFDRSEPGFENVNVLYHITEQQKYFQSLGFTDINNYQMEVDCHGFSGMDQSAFNAGANPPNIIFGEGGVDDAEDADVIIHEYTHGVMQSAAPNTNYGTERNALDEGFGDYMAASYSQKENTWQNNWVFNWDGHNEFWNGRKVTSSAMYPVSLQNNLYKDAPIWSSALMRIERNIGRDKTHILAINAGYNYSGGMTMAQAAQLILQQDSILCDAENYGVICYTFLDKGLVSSCAVNRPANMVGIETINQHNVRVLNSYNFANGMGNLEILANSDFKILVYTIQGKLIANYSSNNKGKSISPNDISPGVYFFQIGFKNTVQTLKIIRY